MPGGVYTQRFVFANGTNLLFAVPAGYRAIVRSLNVYQGAGATGGAAFFVNSIPVAQLLPGEFKSASQEMRVPAYAGETLFVQTFSAASVAVLAGFIFEDHDGPIGRQAERREATPLPA